MAKTGKLQIDIICYEIYLRKPLGLLNRLAHLGAA